MMSEIQANRTGEKKGLQMSNNSNFSCYRNVMANAGMDATNAPASNAKAAMI